MDSAFGPPPTGVDAIVVAVQGGRPFFKYFASIDSTGRALLLRDADHPEQTLVAMLSSGLFYQLVARANSAAEADRMQAERQFDTTTLEGLLEAVKQGAAGCDSHLDGIDRHVTLHVAGMETEHECVGSELASFNRYVVDTVSDAVDEAAALLCE